MFLFFVFKLPFLSVYLSFSRALSNLEPSFLTEKVSLGVFENQQSNISEVNLAIDGYPEVIIESSIRNRVLGIHGRLSREEVGHMQWMILHSMAATFPELPDREEADAMKHYIKALPLIYPCKDCARHFSQLLIDHPPPEFDSRKTLVLYLCTIHNVVNERLRKPGFLCDYEFLSETYPSTLRPLDKDKDCGCDGDPESANEEDKSMNTVASIENVFQSSSSAASVSSLAIIPGIDPAADHSRRSNI